MKALPRGIFTRNGLPPKDVPSVKVATLQVAWMDTEKTPGAFDFTTLKMQLAAARAQGVTAVRIRPMLGVQAPTWAMALDNGPLPYYEPQGKTTVAIPNVWGSTYQAHAERWLSRLAALIDPDPLVCVVFASGAMTYYAEPCIRGAESDVNRTNLVRADRYTYSRDQAAQRWAIDAMCSFRDTRIGLAYNPMQNLETASWTVEQQLSATASLVDYHITTLGQRAIVQNNSMRSKWIGNLSPAMQGLYPMLATAGVPAQYQVAAPERVGDESATIKWLIDNGAATGVEYAHTLTDALYAALGKALGA